MAVSATKKLHLPLPDQTHQRLFEVAREMGVPATRLVRSVIEDWLTARKREQRREELHRFAEKHAGTELDLDRELEGAAVEALLRDE